MSDVRVPDLNMVVVAGRLTRDPEIKYTSSGRAWCNLSVANTRYYKSKAGERMEETVFVEGTVWDQQAEWVNENLSKGRPVIVEGRLRQNEWEDRQSGQKRTKLEIAIQRLTPLDWGGEQRDGGQRGGDRGGDRGAARQEQRTSSPMTEDQDDIPF